MKASKIIIIWINDPRRTDHRYPKNAKRENMIGYMNMIGLSLILKQISSAHSDIKNVD